MSHRHWRQLLGLSFLVVAAVVSAQSGSGPNNSYPNPYQTIENWAQLPPGRIMGSTSAVAIDRDGTSVWLADRCGADGAGSKQNCLTNNTVDPIMKFDASGKLVKSFGAGTLVAPHGIYVDHEGNVWVTDYQDNGPVPGGAAGRGRNPAATRGHQVLKFSAEGKLLMTLGKPGGADAPDYFNVPGAVIVDRSGNIYVGDGGHSGSVKQSRILKFDSSGKLIQTIGGPGSGPGEFSQVHHLAFDPSGRLFVADRGNNRVQIFDKEGKFVAEWKQFGRPSAVFVDQHDVVYVADDESTPKNNPGFDRGMRIGSAKDGKVMYYIPPPSDADGLAVDRNGNVYGAEVNQRTIKKYVKKP